MKQYFKYLWTGLCFSLLASGASAQDGDGIGQTIQIHSRLKCFVGKPSWTLIIRDVDSNQNIPYVFDFKKSTHFWVAMTFGHNYLITVSRLQFSPYTKDPYHTKRIENLCHLESHGRIIKGDSMYITITGHLSPYAERYDCHVSQFQDNHFSIATPES